MGQHTTFSWQFAAYLACCYLVSGASSQRGNPAGAAGAGGFLDIRRDGSYRYAYATGDAGRHYHTAAASPDNTVSGRYGERSPKTGAIQETTYTAGRNGFRARGPHIARKMSLSQNKIPYNPPVSPNSPRYNPTYSTYNDPNNDPTYEFGFRTPTHSRQEASNSRGTVQGSYSYLDDVGTRHNVAYEAGAKTGFHVKTPFPDSDSIGGALFYRKPNKGGKGYRGHSAIQQNTDGSFRFTATGPDQKHTETADKDGNRRGSYTYLDPKGVQRTTEYIAGPNIGYKVINTKLNSQFSAAYPFLPPSFLIPNRDESLNTAATGAFKPDKGSDDYEDKPDDDNAALESSTDKPQDYDEGNGDNSGTDDSFGLGGDKQPGSAGSSNEDGAGGGDDDGGFGQGGDKKPAGESGGFGQGGNKRPVGDSGNKPTGGSVGFGQGGNKRPVGDKGGQSGGNRPTSGSGGFGQGGNKRPGTESGLGGDFSNERPTSDPESSEDVFPTKRPASSTRPPTGGRPIPGRPGRPNRPNRPQTTTFPNDQEDDDIFGQSNPDSDLASNNRVTTRRPDFNDDIFGAPKPSEGVDFSRPISNEDLDFDRPTPRPNRLRPRPPAYRPSGFGPDNQQYGGQDYGNCCNNRGNVKFNSRDSQGAYSQARDYSVRERFFSFPPGVAVRAHVQSLDIVPYGSRMPPPGVAQEQDQGGRRPA